MSRLSCCGHQSALVIPPAAVARVESSLGFITGQAAGFSPRLLAATSRATVAATTKGIRWDMTGLLGRG